MRNTGVLSSEYLGILQESEIRILCSGQSKRNAGVFYGELVSDELPTRLNFITSAYFSGFDLLEDFHLISISIGNNKIHSLSDHKLKQIAGRCRQKLLSEKVIYSVLPSNKTLVKTNIDELIEAAEAEKSALNCLSQQFNKNRLLKDSMSQLRYVLINTLGKKGKQFVREDIDKTIQISYLNIDAFLENQRIQIDLYSDINTLPDLLELEGHHLTKELYNSTATLVKYDIEKENKEISVKELLNKLHGVSSDGDFEILCLDTFTKRQNDILDIFRILYRHIDKGELLKAIEEYGAKTDLRELNRFTYSALYTAFTDANLYKRNVEYHIKIGDKYDPLELIEKWNIIFKESTLHKTITSERNAVRLLKTHFKATRVSNGQYKVNGNMSIKVIAPIVPHYSTRNINAFQNSQNTIGLEGLLKERYQDKLNVEDNSHLMLNQILSTT